MRDQVVVKNIFFFASNNCWHGYEPPNAYELSCCKFNKKRIYGKVQGCTCQMLFELLCSPYYHVTTILLLVALSWVAYKQWQKSFGEQEAEVQ